MTRDEFWKLIESTKDAEDVFEQVEEIQSVLESKSPEEILSFEEHLSAIMADSYRNELWGAAYLINGGCSDDGFDYFRGWLILQGQNVFETAVKKGDSLADLDQLEDEVECEDILYVANSAYESVTGEEIPAVSIELNELGDDWDFDDDAEMKSRYPKLFAMFCEE